MIGRKISAVTLDGGKALSENFLKVALGGPRPANRIEEIHIAGLTNDGLYETGFIRIV
jgi:hypothetical protein